MKLFCLPYAGGSALIYKEWKQFFSGTIELVPVEYSGHGRRSNQPLYKDVNAAIDDIYNIISKSVTDGLPYAIFGHSMGSMLAYEVTQRLRENKMPLPVHIIFSGRGVPHRRSEKQKTYHTMSDQDFQKEIANLGGTPKEFFDHPELMEYLLPILKNDFRISETAAVWTDIRAFDFPITVFMGKEEEEVEAEDVHGWMHHTNQTCVVYYFNGGHFFISEQWETMAGIIQKTLMPGEKAYKLLR